MRTQILKRKILLYLYDVQIVQRTKLYQPFTEYDYKHYAKVVHDLIDEGFIEIKRDKRKNYIEITADGKRYAEVLKSKAETEFPVVNKYNSRITKERRKQYADVAGLCLANEIHVMDHPALELLYGENTNEAKAARELFVQQLENGIYYEIMEVRNAYQALYGKTDLVSRSRLVGVIFYKSRIIYVYAISSTLIVWKTIGESRTIDFYNDFFTKSLFLRKHLVVVNKPEVVVVGDSLSMVPALVHGRKKGIKDSDAKIDAALSVVAQGRINAYNLALIFSQAYFIPTTSMGIGMMRVVCALDNKTRDVLFSKWLDKRGYMKMTTRKYTQGIDRQTGRRIIFAPYMDLIELEHYCKQNEKAHFVIPHGTQDAISRTVGPLLESAEDMRGVALKFKSYDENGVAVDGKWLKNGQE